MIISHIPAGYITTFLSKKWWQKDLSKKQTFWMFIIGALAGTFPDIDLLYYYFVDAESSHREFFTHSIIFYLLIFLAIFIISKLLNNYFIKGISYVIFIATLSHLILDSFTAGVPWLYPFSSKLFGLSMLPGLNGGFYGHNIFVFTWTTEIFLILYFVYLLLRQRLAVKKYLNIYVIASVVLLTVFTTSTYFINKNLYHHDAISYYGDYDNDGEINLKDSDMDGDGVYNIKDDDANANGIDNKTEVVEFSTNLQGLYYDVTEDGIGDMLSRLGFVSNSDVVLKSFDHAGIFLGNEMRGVYSENSDEFTATPKEQAFEEAIVNLYIYCKKEGYLIDNSELPKVGDIVFYKNGGIKYVSLVVEVIGNDVQVIYGGKENSRIMKTNISSINKNAGEIFAFGRILE